MKKSTAFAAALLPAIACSIILAACTKDRGFSVVKIYTPVYKPAAEVRAAIKTGSPEAITNAGKLFLWGNYMLLNEVNKGIHIIDNSNPKAPVNKAFISIPGNLDIMVKGNTLYADCYNDLLVIDVANMQNVQCKTFFHNTFPDRQYVLNSMVPDGQIIVDWKVRDTTMDIAVTQNQGIWKDREYYTRVVFPGLNDFYAAQSNLSANAQLSNGIAGSASRFTVLNNYLYTVGSSQLSAFNITNPANPVLAGTSSTGVAAQTIFALNNKLFVGGSNGISIFSVDDASTPVEEGMFGHFCCSDPVIADDSIAYVTLHTGNACNANIDELDVLDVTNIQQPQLIKTYPLAGPEGLSKDGNLLFICDGASSLKIFDAAKATDIKLLHTINISHPFDVICYNKIAFVATADGIYQYDYSDINNIKLLSKITL